MSETKAQRLFRAKVRRDCDSGCDIWTAATRRGYGAFGVNRRMQMAHRVAWEFAYGPIPDGMCVCHKCDNTRCVNTEHLFLGTIAQNAADRNTKGRQARGEAHGRARLSAEQVAQILKEHTPGGRATEELARRFGCSKSTIRIIARRRSWAWLSGASEAQEMEARP